MLLQRRRILRSPVLGGALAAVAVLATCPWLFTNVFSANYMPHGYCFLWDPRLLGLHVTSDLVTGLSYVVIAASLVRLVYLTRREIPFQGMFLTFGVFILACGFTHFMAVVVLWKPLYWLEGDMKLITAVASAITAAVLPVYLPRIRGVIQGAAASAENERRFLAAANSSLDSIYILEAIRDPSGEIADFRFVFVNSNAACLISRTPEEIVGQQLCVLLPINRTNGMFDKYRQIVETGEPIGEEMAIQEKTVKASWLKIQAVRLDDGVAITTSDITARKRLEFERTKAFTRSLINSSPAAIVVTDLSHTITAINPAAEKMLWYRPEELIGKHTPLLFYDPLEIEEKAKRLSSEYGMPVAQHEVIFFVSRARGVDDEAEWSFVRKGGGRLTVQVTVTPLVGDGAEDSGFMITAYDISERKRREEYISHISQHDALTGLPTRHLLFDRVQGTIARSDRNQTFAGLLMIDLNNFKQVNDSVGHHGGDRLLIEVAARLKKAVRATDTVARMGGDEFVVLLGDLHDGSEASRIAANLSEQLRKPYLLSDHMATTTTASIGICVYPNPSISGNAVESMLKCADVAMYYAKSTGAAVEVYSDELARSSYRKQEIAAGLRGALLEGEFEVHYQPQLDLRTNTVCGFEALLRWRSKRLGDISPTEFIPIAEETGLIHPLGEWVLKEACKGIRRLMDRKNTGFTVAVNLSPLQLDQDDLVGAVENALQEHDVPADYLELEITEGALMKESLRTAMALQGLRSLGVRIAIDDFGTGFSNMSYLLQMPVDCLKIDRSIVSGCSVVSNSSTVTSAIIALAHQLSLTVVAEGAETLEEVEFLRAASCDRVQGFYFSTAQPLAVIESFDFSEAAGGNLFLPCGSSELKESWSGRRFLDRRGSVGDA
jgi:diguanylate cyclase (GGDEF)-like protein/PAS domain S-box-containing protein